MRLLVLGGTAPLGRTVAARARDAGHDVTCLARGESGPVPDGVRLVPADRSGPDAYDEVAGLEWDEVLEVSWQPGLVRSALRALAGRAVHWTYVSSSSVYARHDEPGADETAELLAPLDEGVDVVDAEQYGPAKVRCEVDSASAVGDRLHVSRAGLLAGPGDRSDRAGYWPARFARGGDVLVPAARGQHAQVLDLRDYADFLVGAGERGEQGTMNAVGEVVPLPDALTLAEELGSSGRPVVVADDWLVAQGVEPYMGPESLPLWLPEPEYAGWSARSDADAVASGLRRRPLADTFAAALEDERRWGLDRERKAGLSAPREAELLAAWRSLLSAQP